MSLRTRIDKLERGRPDDPCAVCADWPEYRIETPEGATVEGFGARRCWLCGREPSKLLVMTPPCEGATV